MRIIAGALGGRRLKAPQGRTTRPTSERVREAIFSILGPPPTGTRVLDLFAGAGALGLEALSRGAVAAVFVDTSAPALRCLRENIETLAVGDATRVHRLDSRKALGILAGRFRWVFVDPPYRGDLAATILDSLGLAATLEDDCVVVVEHDRRSEPDSRYGCLVRTDLRRYGDTAVSFFRQGES